MKTLVNIEHYALCLGWYVMPKAIKIALYKHHRAVIVRRGTIG
jgi:hypothetical protein